MRHRNIDFIANRKKYFIASSILILLIVLCTMLFGVQLDIAFRGGTIIDYTYDGEAEAISTHDIQSIAEQVLEESVSINRNFDRLKNKNGFQIVLTSQNSVDSEVMETLQGRLKQEFSEHGIEQSSLRSVNPSMGMEFFKKCLLAILVGSLFILLYIGVRFRRIGGFSAGSFAVVALLHDVIVVFGAFVIFRIPISDSFIAATLTVIGYSINSSIVIYDRIRENEQLYKHKSLAEVVNLSINQTMTRNVNTTITTLTAMIVILIVTYLSGVTSIVSFVLPITLGILSGFYSSVFLASELWVTWKQRKAPAQQPK